MEIEPRTETKENWIVRKLQAMDIPQIEPVLRMCIRDSETGEILEEEVKEVLEVLRTVSAKGYAGDRHYSVATDKTGKVVGIMGLKKPDERMMKYKMTDNPIEIVNAFVSTDHRNNEKGRSKGVGSALLRDIVEVAAGKGHTEILLNSGPRYKNTGWHFWNKHFGTSTITAQGYYGEGRDAPVWRAHLPMIVK